MGFHGVEKLSNDSDVLKTEIGKWQGIHPFLSDYKGIITAHYVSDVLAENSKRIVEAQIESSDKIVASIDFNAEEISKNFSNSIEDLNSTFEWGFTEVLWQLEQQQKTLKDVLKTLQKPLTTQSIELRERGFYAYTNRLYDDAITDLQRAAEDNRYDFTIHQTLGNIFLFHKFSSEKAIENYQKAVKYSEPRSKKFASFSCLHLGLVYYLIHDYQNAYNSTMKAINLSPDTSLCYYEHARYCAKLNKKDETVASLKKIVYQEPFYCVKINSEPDFSLVSNDVKRLIDDVFQHFKQISKNRINEVHSLIKTAESWGIIPMSLEEFANSLKTSEQYHSKSSILDFQKSIIESENTLTDLFVFMKKYLDDQTIAKENEIKETPKLVDKETTDYRNKIFLIMVGIFIILPIIFNNIWGLIYGIVIFVALIFILVIITEYRNGPKIKQRMTQANTSLEKLKHERSKIEEQIKKFSNTFNRINTVWSEYGLTYPQKDHFSTEKKME